MRSLGLGLFKCSLNASALVLYFTFSQAYSNPLRGSSSFGSSVAGHSHGSLTTLIEAILIIKGPSCFPSILATHPVSVYAGRRDRSVAPWKGEFEFPDIAHIRGRHCICIVAPWLQVTEPDDLVNGCSEPLDIFMSELGLPGNSTFIVQRDGVYFPVGLAQLEFEGIEPIQVPMVVGAGCRDTCRRPVVDVFAVEPPVKFGLSELGVGGELNIGNAFVVTDDV